MGIEAIKVEPSEQKALLQIKEIADIYGYGNCIAFLKRAWIIKLKREWDLHLSEEGTNVESYSEELFNKIITG
jgi:hypothetical protein